MLIPLDVPFVDARAAALTFALGEPEHDALCATTVDLGDVAPGARLDLRVLGASHQVLLGCAHDDVPVLSEVVACLPRRDGGLPAVHEAPHGRAGAYRFSSTVTRGGADDVARVVGELQERLAGRPDALVGVFPGRRHAVTALETTRGRVGAKVVVGWTTWHTYPEAGEVVRTSTTLTLAPVHASTADAPGTCTVCADRGDVVSARGPVGAATRGAR